MYLFIVKQQSQQYTYKLKIDTLKFKFKLNQISYSLKKIYLNI